MRKRQRLNILIILAAIALFCGTGCSMFTKYEPEEKEWLTVFVEINSSIPKPAESNEAERSAMPSGFKDMNGGNLIFACGIHDGTLSDADLEKTLSKCEFNLSDNSISIPFDKSSEDRTGYKLSVYTYASDYDCNSGFSISSALLYGETEISIPANATTATAGKVFLAPSSSSTVKGTVEISIKIPDDYELVCSNSEFDCTKVGDVYVVKPASPEGLYGDTYTVSFIMKKSDAIVYAWTETINVYPGMKTNVWNTGVDNSNGELEITSVKISSTFYVRGSSGTDSWYTSNVSKALGGDDDTGDGSIGKPYATVQKAIDKVFAINKGDDGEAYTIFVDGTVQNKNSDASVVADFSSFGNDKPKMTLSIIGLGAEKAVLQGRGSTVTFKDSVILISNSDTQLDLTLENLKITGGEKTNGGGIYNGEKSKITIKDCEISDNHAIGNGGGIYNKGTVVISGGMIKDNSAAKGSGIYNDGALEFSGSVKVDAGNDVHLPIDAEAAGYNRSENKNAIKITGDLTETAVATVTLDSYYNNAVVLFSDDDESLIHRNLSKIKLSNSDFDLVQYDSNKKQAVTVSHELQEVIYLDSSSGSDMKSGKDDNLPVKTLSRACALLDYSAANPKIVIMKGCLLEAEDAGLLDFSGKVAAGKKVTIQRYYKDESNRHTGFLINLRKNSFTQENPVVLKNVVLDGNWKADGGSGAEQFDENQNVGTLLLIKDGDYVIIEADTVFKNNFGGSGQDGAAITNLGTLIINGGEISGNKCLAEYVTGGIIFNIYYGTLTINGGTISDNEGGVYGCIANNGNLTITGGSILNNKASSLGVICNKNNGTLTITGGTISGNTATNGGNGIYNNSSSAFNLSGAAQIDDEIYLGNSSGDVPITITGNLTASTVARISLYTYASDVQVLSAGTGVTITKDICKKFILNEEGDPSKASTEFAIIPNANKTAGVLKKPSGSVTVTLPGSYTFTLSGLTDGKVQRGSEISFSVKDSSNNDPTVSDYSMSLKQLGSAFITADKNKITVPSWLFAGQYAVHMKAKINGKWYDDTATIEVIE